MLQTTQGVHSITTRTPTTPTVDTLHPTAPSLPTTTIRTRLSILLPPQTPLGHPTYTTPSKIRLLSLHTPQTTQLLIPLLLPLRNQVRIRIPILQQPVVQLFRDGFARVVQVVNVSGAGMGDLEDRPEGFVFLFAVCGGGLGVAHLVRVGEEGVFYVVEAGWGGFAAFCGGAYWWHGFGWA